MKENLDFNTNLNIAKIFLNIFGFSLEQVCCFINFNSLKIYNAMGVIVGELTIESNQTIIKVDYDEILLTANYAFNSLVWTSFDSFNWTINIHFNYNRKNTLSLDGQLIIDGSNNKSSKTFWQGKAIINGHLLANENFSLNFGFENKLFEANICSSNQEESIRYTPYDGYLGFFVHNVQNFEIVSNQKAYFYRKYAGVFSAPNFPDSKLQIFLIETKDDVETNCINEIVNNFYYLDENKSMLHKILIMYQLDGDLKITLMKLRNILFFDGVSIFDNFVKICCHNFDKKQLAVLFGTDIPDFKYDYVDTNLMLN